MLVRGMRWGYEGDDCACGMGEGSTFAEIMVTDEKGRNWFVLVSKILEFERFYIAPVPLFDLEMHLFDYEVTYDYESAKIKEALTEEYACREGVMPEAVLSSRFYGTVKLGRLAVRECEKLGEPDETGARAFISAYLGLSPDAEEIPDL